MYVKTPSIKDVKHKDLGNTDAKGAFCLRHRHKAPSNFLGMLQLSRFKKEFLRFLIREYEDSGYVSVIGASYFIA